MKYSQDESEEGGRGGGFEIKIADFGLSAPLFRDGYKNFSLNSKCGTLPYMAPELALDHSHSKVTIEILSRQEEKN